jgi:hypothetical protein
MITRHGVSKDNISAYTLISSDYQTVTMNTKDLQTAIANKKIAVTNLEVTNKGLASTNGALDKYTFVNTQTNQVEGMPRAVILDRVEQGGKLVGYTVFTQNGTIAELNILDAATLADKKLLSNGKIRHTEDGDIVSAIGGNFPLREIPINKAPKGETSVNLMYFGTVVGAPVEYFGAIVSCTSATEMSKLIDALSKSNARVVATVAKVGGQSVRSSLAIQRFGANSLYGVFEIDILDKLIKSNATVQNKIGNIIVSAVKYVSEGETYEQTFKLNSNWKIENGNNDQSNDDHELVKKCKEYTKKVIEKFGNTPISK